MQEGLYTSINAVFPSVLIIVIGYVIKKTGLIRENSFSDLNKAVFCLFLPVSLFNSIESNRAIERSALSALTFSAVSFIAIILLSMFLIRFTTWTDR